MFQKSINLYDIAASLTIIDLFKPIKLVPFKRLSKKKLILLGRLTTVHAPELSSQLMQVYINEDDVETDISKINFYYQVFESKSQQVPCETKSEIVNHKMIFIAAMLLIYFPKSFIQPTNSLLIGRGFVRNIADAMGLARPGVSKNIRQVVVHYRTYADFKEKCDSAKKIILAG